MKIKISSGHGLYIRGAAYYIDEVDEARKVTNKVAEYLKQLGCGVEVFHDNTSKTQRDNINRIVSEHNASSRDLDVSVHFNAASVTALPRGTEVLYVSQQALAAKVSAAIAAAGDFKDRGAKYRDNLGFLNNTNKPSILLEICFVDSQEDVRLYRQNFDAICRATAESIAGKKLVAPAPVVTSAATNTPGSYRVYTGSFGHDAAGYLAAEEASKEIQALGYYSFAKEDRAWTGTFGSLEDARRGRDLIESRLGYNPSIRDMNSGQDVN